MLKPFNELVKLDVRPLCGFREAKDERGNTVKVPYLGWANCVKLLHENGAESVCTLPGAARRPTATCGHRPK